MEISLKVNGVDHPLDLDPRFTLLDALRHHLRHDRSPLWIVADPPWHTVAVGGRSHHQSRCPQIVLVGFANKALIRCSYSNDRFTVNLNSFGKAPDALHQAPLVPVTSRYLMARMSKLWTLATTPSSHPPATNSAARSFSSPAT